MIYAINVMELKVHKAAILVNALDGLSSVLVAVIAYIAEAHTNLFNVIIFSTGLYAMGLIVLWIILWASTEVRMFYVAVFLIAMGKAGVDPPLKAFLDYQLRGGKQIVQQKYRKDDQEQQRREVNIQDDQEEQRDVGIAIWWHSAWICGSIVALILLAKDIIFRHLFKIMAIITGTTYLLFFSGLIICFDPEELTTYRQHRRDPTRNSFVDIYRTFNEASNKIYEMDNYINGDSFLVPATFFFVLKYYICDMVLFLFWWKRKSVADEQRRIKYLRIRIGVGIVCAIVSCIAAWQVERRRVHLIDKELAMGDQNKTSTSLSILWLTPQYLLLGLMEGLAGGGLVTFYYNRLPKHMKNFSKPFSELVLSIGKFSNIILLLIFRSWFKQYINTSHLDRYFLMLAILSSVSLCIYCCTYKSAVDEKLSVPTVGDTENSQTNNTEHSQEAPSENKGAEIVERGQEILDTQPEAPAENLEEDQT
ncbi:protein NRT1/ PTR FAMILY 5.7-like [Quillaja saponaria]|uniref:Protein NRT1/ PTR FAMILY 5.7-like n=1 Tax=Quillaja saponaria TaxID=32244 RepID=A0AAD7PNN0_QUISA|nr:protein NRT1/ PTR FAMILY 5.7-like [Quillaja saponaria]